MPALSARFESIAQAPDLHEGLARVRDGLPEALGDAVDVILCGPPGAGKYTQAIKMVARYSPSELRYNRTLNVEHDRGRVPLRMSDVHFEVDMEFLGCQSRTLWPAIYEHITDAVSARDNKHAIVVCKNFHATHKELLETFYYYLGGAVSYILITEHLSPVPRRIVDRCLVVSVPRPPRSRVLKAGLPGGRTNLGQDPQHCESQAARTRALEDEAWERAGACSWRELRETLYKLMVEQHQVTLCPWSWMTRSIREGRTTPAEAIETVRRFSEGYANNYRPIYHLERVVLALVHGRRKAGEEGSQAVAASRVS
jgi:hypothetical protein